MEDVLVIDAGSDTFRAGRSVDFPSDNQPSVILPSEVIVRPPGTSENVPANAEAQKAASLEKYQKVYDVNGSIQNWEGYESIIYHILYEQLGWPLGDESYLIGTDNMATSRHDRERITQLMFETFNVMGYYLVDSAVASLHAMGKLSGVVVDIGHSGTEIAQVMEGALMPAASQRVSLGGWHLDQCLQSLLAQQGTQLTLIQCHRLKEEIAKIHETADAFLAGDGAETSTHTLPDGQKITISNEGYTMGEALLKPALLPLELQDPLARPLGIAEAAYAFVMQQTDPALRKIQFENMLVCGGGSCIPAIAQRFVKEVKLLAPPSVMPALILAPEYMPDKVTQYSSFMGAAILSKVINVTAHCVSKADYEDYGPTIVHKKC